MSGQPRRRLAGSWIAGILVSLPLLYLLSFGPACWWCSDWSAARKIRPPFTDGTSSTIIFHFAPKMYWPLGAMVARNGSGKVSGVICWYATLRQPRLYLPTDSSGTAWHAVGRY